MEIENLQLWQNLKFILSNPLKVSLWQIWSGFDKILRQGST